MNNAILRVAEKGHRYSCWLAVSAFAVIGVLAFFASASSAHADQAYSAAIFDVLVFLCIIAPALIGGYYGGAAVIDKIDELYPDAAIEARPGASLFAGALLGIMAFCVFFAVFLVLAMYATKLMVHITGFTGNLGVLFISGLTIGTTLSGTKYVADNW